MLRALGMQVLVARGRRVSLLPSSGMKQRASSSRGFQGRCHPGQGHIKVASQAGQMM